MRKSILTLAFIIAGIGSWAQMKEGSVQYDMEFNSNDPEMAMAIMMMTGSTMKMYFKEDASRVEVAMGSMMNMVTVSDEKEKKAMLLMSIPMMSMNQGTIATLEEMEGLKSDETKTPEIQLVKGKKKILGYKCKKAITVDESGNEAIFWYTDKIVVNTKGQSYLNEKVPGLPLEYEINQNGMVVKMTAKEVSESLSNEEKGSLFTLAIPEGYDVKTLEEMMSMGGGE